MIKNKEAKTVLNAFEKIWVLQGPGMPSRAIFSDRGLEFVNQHFSDFCKSNNIKHLTTAGYSPWSNGKNERGHSVCDLAMLKIMEDDKKISIEEALDRAVCAKNMEIGRLGFSPMQIAHGRSPFIPGISDGNINSDEVPDSELVNQIMERMRKTREEFRKADSSERLKKLMKERLYHYRDVAYEAGDKVYVQDRITGKWEGLAIVKCHQGSEVKIIKDKSEWAVSNIRVRPFEEEVIDSDDDISNTTSNKIKNISTNEKNRDVPDDDEKINPTDNTNPNKDINPIKNITTKETNQDNVPTVGENVKVFTNDKKKILGKVLKIDTDGMLMETKEREEKIVKLKDIQKWVPARKVSFDVTCKRDEGNIIREDESEGVNFLFYTREIRNTVIPLDEEEILEVFATEIPTKYQNTPEVIAAKQVEYDNYVKFEAFEEVEDKGQERIKTRWVCSKKEKQDGMKVDYKARLVVKGFMEHEYPRSDSPTIAKESLKLFLAISANEGFELTNLDIKNGYLQGVELAREIFAEPPPEFKRDGIIWRLKKAANGLYDGGRHLYLRIDEVLRELGMKKVTGDEALYTYHDENGKLAGLVCLYVDDFNSAGTEKFHNLIIKPLQRKFTFGKKEDKKFRFAGFDISKEKDAIIVDQNDYKDSLQMIEVEEKDEGNR